MKTCSIIVNGRAEYVDSNLEDIDNSEIAQLSFSYYYCFICSFSHRIKLDSLMDQRCVFAVIKDGENEHKFQISRVYEFKVRQVA